MPRYLARTADQEMRDLLRATGCVVVEGVIADMGARDNGSMKPHTAADYLGALERIMIVEN